MLFWNCLWNLDAFVFWHLVAIFLWHFFGNLKTKVGRVKTRIITQRFSYLLWDAEALLFGNVLARNFLFVAVTLLFALLLVNNLALFAILCHMNVVVERVTLQKKINFKSH